MRNVVCTDNNSTCGLETVEDENESSAYTRGSNQTAKRRKFRRSSYRWRRNRLRMRFGRSNSWPEDGPDRIGRLRQRHFQPKHEAHPRRSPVLAEGHYAAGLRAISDGQRGVGREGAHDRIGAASCTSFTDNVANLQVLWCLMRLRLFPFFNMNKYLNCLRFLSCLSYSELPLEKV